MRLIGVSEEEIKERHYIANRTQIKNRAIYQIDYRTGEIIKKWDRISDVERELNINHSRIVACCTLKPQTKTAGGFTWRYIEDYNPEKDKEQLIKYSKRVPNNSKTILQFDKNNQLLNTYINATEAAEYTGIGKSSILKYCRGEKKDPRGFIWQYENKNKEK